jgi:hypothetical protein
MRQVAACARRWISEDCAHTEQGIHLLAQAATGGEAQNSPKLNAQKPMLPSRDNDRKGNGHRGVFLECWLRAREFQG